MLPKMNQEKTKTNNIWAVTREYGALAGAGGVKDVSKQLACALARSGRKVSVVLPCYGFINPSARGFSLLDLAFEVDLSYAQEERKEFIKVWHTNNGVDLYLIDSKRFAEKGGVYAYTDKEALATPSRAKGGGHFDYFAMNVLLQKAAIALIIHLDQKPDVIHCHDGHTALLPAMVRESEGFRHYFRNTGFIVTIHNAGIGYHQEVEDLEFANAICGLPKRVIDSNLLGLSFDPLLCAANYAVINTVSENYARELQQTEDDRLTGWLGHLLKDRDVTLEGVTNGIDPADFELANYKQLGLPTSFKPGTIKNKGKMLCRQDLLSDISAHKIDGLQQTGTLAWQPKQPLFTFIGRFSTQKGVDKMIIALKNMLPINPDFQILILGSGQKDIEDSLIELASDPKNDGRICVLQGFDPITANRIYAAGDFFLIPSRYEPCGLTDYIAQLFANIPIVHHIGGLVKVVDGETGYAFYEHSGEALAEIMQEAMYTFRNDRASIAAMQKKAIALIKKQYTWDSVMDQYLVLFDKARKSVQL